MQAIISPGKISGDVTPPPSKSMMQRACAAALLNKGRTTILNPGTSNDDKAALNIIQQLGAKVVINNNSVEISSDGLVPITNTIDCGESGLSTRVFTTIAALHNEPVTIVGHGSLLHRPMDFFEKVLPQLGVTVASNNGHLPITVKGLLTAKDITIDGSASSQYLSGLLMAYCYHPVEQLVRIHVDELKSKPYADLTIEVLQQFGAVVLHQDHKLFAIKKAIQPGNVTINIEADWSASANWLVASAIAGVVTIHNLNLDSVQADKAIIRVVSTEKKAFEFDATDCPDVIPILAVYAGNCNGDSVIKGIHRLVNKESNRIESTSKMLEQLGVLFEIKNDAFYIHGMEQFNSCIIDSYNDHRIAMAAAVAALNADGDVTINNAEAVNKSYPDFFSHLSSLGAKCILKHE
ncbi:MAG: 3-phosphoshikimate 1-carboxyvinyltransferase [Bacteroidetes bacterium 43-93]|nr:3-phosphoshikimate 1-carboxyvinyltransferase [Bacteroidota bacterium]OJW97363.1 MAG: 3-phosphoshikimate 1-carboxyvinyltransferase [Bacteroidetes bacterium 43-93]